MNARNRAMKDDARPDLHDALLPREREVLRRWDRGDSREAIALALGLATKTVRDITIAFDDRPELTPHSNKSLQADLVERNRVFVERIRAMQAHVALKAGAR